MSSIEQFIEQKSLTFLFAGQVAMIGAPLVAISAPFVHLPEINMAVVLLSSIWVAGLISALCGFIGLTNKAFIP